MAEIVNLRKARKARDRAADAARAEANRVQFGRPKAERDRAAAEARRTETVLDGHRRDEP